MPAGAAVVDIEPDAGDKDAREVWVITDSSSAFHKFGDTVAPSKGSVVCGNRGLFKVVTSKPDGTPDADAFFCMEKVSKDDVKGLVKRFSERLAAAPPAAGG